MIHWLDVMLHALGALVIVTALDAVVGEPVLALMANTAFWPLRELYQHGGDWSALVTHPQVVAEWTVPVALGFACAGNRLVTA